jgi:hypothetical protein
MYLKRKSGNFFNLSVGHSLEIFLIACRISATDALLVKAVRPVEGEVGALFPVPEPLFSFIMAPTQALK